ncbi:MAG: hypothetical protein KME36_17595 [Candidatus Thiodiazotropha sp. (ex Lucina pensylvanica)]|nr:hypothetical protein [Candidatus Thiodiazotropha sp. (ex Lucina pensylvanica)]MBT3052569.1 hypothetical protein [Candidatus Thiodiazotropha sp. (ex Codakia orbicularis)]
MDGATGGECGVEMDRDVIEDEGWHEVTNPIIHDSVDVCPAWPVCFSGPDREFMYANGSDIVNQQAWSGAAGDDSMDYVESQPFFDDQFMEDVPCGFMWLSACREKGVGRGGDRSKVGAIILEDESNPTEAIDTYSEWLTAHYGLNIDINHRELH